ncbi:MAG: protein kinase, partial [Myxococcota bacterium]
MDVTRRTFAIETCLGRGGFGEVYRAEMTSSNGLSTAVALKVLRRDVTPGGQAMQRLKDEARALARVNHPAILRVHDLVLIDGRVALITEYVDGEDLEKCLRGEDRIGTRALIEVLSQVVAALDAAYTAPIGDGGAPLKLVHRDVKPSNVRIGRHADVKLLDFGIARTDEVTREARTQTDMMVGSPPYMAPERFLDAIPRPASDLFAVGCVLLEGLVGKRVFDLPVTMLASLAVDRRRYETHVQARLDEIPRGEHPGVTALVAELLQYDPDLRPQASEVVARMDALADRLTGPTLVRFCRDRRWREPPREVGDLMGRVMSAGTLDPSGAGSEEFLPSAPATTPMTEPVPTSPPVTEGSRTGSLVWLGGAGVLSGLVLLAAGGGATIALALLVMWGRPQPAEPRDGFGAPVDAPAIPGRAPVAPVAPVLPPVTPVAPVLPPVTPDDPAVDPPQDAPVEPPDGPPVRIDDPKPSPGPDPGVQQPRPAPRPVVPVQPGVSVRATDVNWAALVVEGRTVRLPAVVPPGNYALQGQFADGEDIV